MSASLRDTIQQLAASFAAGVLGAIRGSSLEDILAETGGLAQRGRGRSRLRSSAGRRVGGLERGDGGRLGRRSEGALGRVVDAIVDVLAQHPKGLRAEQIRAELGLSAKELPRPIAKALEAKRIRKIGQKRATTYFAAGDGGGRPARGETKSAKGRASSKPLSSPGRRAAPKKPAPSAPEAPPSPSSA